MKTLALSLALLGAIATPVAAADLIFDEPIHYDEPVYYTDAGFDWNGFYAGVVGGYVNGTSTSVGDVTGAITDVPLRGGMIGMTVGGNAQFGTFLFGAEGDLSWSGASGSTACTTVPAYDCNSRVDWIGTLRGRAGVTFDNVLVFATGGLAVAGGEGTITPTFPGTTSTFSDTFIGWTLGAGVEMAVGDALSVKAEYGYADLGSRTAPNGTLGTIQSNTVSPVVHTVKAGLNYHF